MTAAKVARTSSLSRHGQCSDQNCKQWYECGSTRTGAHTLVFQALLSICTDEAGVLCPNPRLAGRVIRVMGREILLVTANFEHAVGFRSDINANLMHDVSLLMRNGKLPFILGSGFQLPAQFVAGLVCSWRQSLDPKVGSIGGHCRGFHTHTCRAGRGQKNLTSLITSWCQHSFELW